MWRINVFINRDHSSKLLSLWENRILYAFLRQTDRQTDGPNALRRSCCRERRLNYAISSRSRPVWEICVFEYWLCCANVKSNKLYRNLIQVGKCNISSLQNCLPTRHLCSSPCERFADITLQACIPQSKRVVSGPTTLYVRRRRPLLARWQKTS